MGFLETIRGLSWESLERTVLDTDARRVEQALWTERRTPEDLLALLSPAAESYLEEMAQQAHRITLQRFGRTILMYAPIYLSSECTNSCVYCGFNRRNRIHRATLSVEEAYREGEALRALGFRHVLLVSGESPRHVPVEYLCRVAERLHTLFASISIEVYPLDEDSYRALIACGVDGLTIYQETYHRERYARVHPAGRKRDYEWRLDTPDRGGRAGFRRLNIGALLGLSPWRTEGAMVGLHAAYLSRKYWRSQVSVSFPRLRPAAGGYEPEFPVNDAAMVQLMCALRLFLPDAGLVLSTRESADFRDHLIPLGVTQMSAGSCTAPGGYASGAEAEGQFEISDHRSPDEVARVIAEKGYEPVWKDWDATFLAPASGSR